MDFDSGNTRAEYCSGDKLVIEEFKQSVNGYVI